MDLYRHKRIFFFFFQGSAKATNFFTTFLQPTNNVTNSYWFSSGPTTDFTFPLINNHSLHQQFVKNFVKKFATSHFPFFISKQWGRWDSNNRHWRPQQPSSPLGYHLNPIGTRGSYKMSCLNFKLLYYYQIVHW